jgi:hypothetical protein
MNPNTSSGCHSQRHTHTFLDDGLYLSPGFAATDEAVLTADGITHVSNVAIHLETQRFLTIHVLHLQLHDSP